MAVLASKVSIISQAYFLLGKDPVNTLTTTDPTDVGASQRYDVIIPTLLSSTHWKHAGKVIDLTRTTDKPPTQEWQYTFQLPNPAEMLLIYKVYPDNFSYEIIGDKLYSNNDTVTLFYIYDPDEGTFPMYFVNYVVYTIAAEIAMAVTQKVTLEELWRKRAQESGVIATALDYQQAPSHSIIYDGLERAHGSLGRYRMTTGGFV